MNQRWMLLSALWLALVGASVRREPVAIGWVEDHGAGSETAIVRGEAQAILKEGLLAGDRLLTRQADCAGDLPAAVAGVAAQLAAHPHPAALLVVGQPFVRLESRSFEALPAGVPIRLVGLAAPEALAALANAGRRDVRVAPADQLLAAVDELRRDVSRRRPRRCRPLTWPLLGAGPVALSLAQRRRRAARRRRIRLYVQDLEADTAPADLAAGRLVRPDERLTLPHGAAVERREGFLYLSRPSTSDGGDAIRLTGQPVALDSDGGALWVWAQEERS